MRNIVRVTVGFRGPAGAIDFSTVTLATGAPGTEVTYKDGVLTIPRGNSGSGEGGSFTGVTVAADGNLTGLGTTDSPLALSAEFAARVTALENEGGSVAFEGVTLAADSGLSGNGTDASPLALSEALLARLTALEQANGGLSESLGGLTQSLASAGAAIGAQAEAIIPLTARVDQLEANMPQVQAFDTTAEATAFSNARPGNIGFSREV